MSNKKWLVYECEDDIHVVPTNDKKNHHLILSCPCHPKMEFEKGYKILVIHNAFDFREIIEELEHDKLNS